MIPSSRAGLAAALLALATGCSGSAGRPPAVECGAAADADGLVVGALPACGTASWPTAARHHFPATRGVIYTVTLVGTAGDADLCVEAPSEASLGCSLNAPPRWVDRLTFTATQSGDYRIQVYDLAPRAPRSTYAIQVSRQAP